MADQCYFNGEFYQCVTATSAGETPVTHPAKWRRIRIPAAWRNVLARLAYSKLLEFDGQKDKARVEEKDARTMDGGLDDLVRAAANSERNDDPNVQTPYV